MVLCPRLLITKCVALLAEGVDRNRKTLDKSAVMWVALLAEGVDRNTSALPSPQKAGESPSSRRAWIEIMKYGRSLQELAVALLAEGVDRNINGTKNTMQGTVALLAEGVDRNMPTLQKLMEQISRPPRGGRG